MNNISPRLLEFRRRADKIPVWSGKGYAPSREVPKYDGLIFERTQSAKMARSRHPSPRTRPNCLGPPSSSSLCCSSVSSFRTAPSSSENTIEVHRWRLP